MSNLMNNRQLYQILKWTLIKYHDGRLCVQKLHQEKAENLIGMEDLHILQTVRKIFYNVQFQLMLHVVIFQRFTISVQLFVEQLIYYFQFNYFYFMKNMTYQGLVNKMRIFKLNSNWAQQYVQEREKLHAKKPAEVEISRIIASNQLNLIKFYDTLFSLYRRHKYPLACIYNFDETSLLIKRIQQAFRICSTEVDVIPLAPQQLITSSTAAFCVAADGSKLPTALIMSETLELQYLGEYISDNMILFQNKKGWMTKQIFRYLMMKVYIPAILERMTHFPNCHRSLLLIDAHASRFCYDVWEYCAQVGIDVLIAPSHVTHLIQPLDNGPNAVFKQELKKHSHLPTRKQDMEMEVKPFIQSVENAIQRTLTVMTIKAGFRDSSTVPYNRQLVFAKIPKFPPKFAVEILQKKKQRQEENVQRKKLANELKRKKSKSIKQTEQTENMKITLNDQLITEQSFLNKWKQFEETQIQYNHEREMQNPISIYPKSLKLIEQQRLNQLFNIQQQNQIKYKKQHNKQLKNQQTKKKKKKGITQKSQQNESTEEFGIETTIKNKRKRNNKTQSSVDNIKNDKQDNITTSNNTINKRRRLNTSSSNDYQTNKMNLRQKTKKQNDFDERYFVTMQSNSSQNSCDNNDSNQSKSSDFHLETDSSESNQKEDKIINQTSIKIDNEMNIKLENNKHQIYQQPKNKLFSILNNIEINEKEELDEKAIDENIINNNSIQQEHEQLNQLKSEFDLINKNDENNEKNKLKEQLIQQDNNIDEQLQIKTQTNNNKPPKKKSSKHNQQMLIDENNQLFNIDIKNEQDKLNELKLEYNQINNNLSINDESQPFQQINNQTKNDIQNFKSNEKEYNNNNQSIMCGINNNIEKEDKLQFKDQIDIDQPNESRPPIHNHIIKIDEDLEQSGQNEYQNIQQQGISNIFITQNQQRRQQSNQLYIGLQRQQIQNKNQFKNQQQTQLPNIQTSSSSSSFQKLNISSSQKTPRIRQSKQYIKTVINQSINQSIGQHFSLISNRVLQQIQQQFEKKDQQQHLSQIQINNKTNQQNILSTPKKNSNYQYLNLKNQFISIPDTLSSNKNSPKSSPKKLNLISRNSIANAQKELNSAISLQSSRKSNSPINYSTPKQNQLITTTEFQNPLGLSSTKQQLSNNFLLPGSTPTISQLSNNSLLPGSTPAISQSSNNSFQSGSLLATSQLSNNCSQPLSTPANFNQIQQQNQSKLISQLNFSLKQIQFFTQQAQNISNQLEQFNQQQSFQSPPSPSPRISVPNNSINQDQISRASSAPLTPSKRHYQNIIYDPFYQHSNK